VALIVQKYGGTSVGSIERIKAVAERCGSIPRQGRRLGSGRVGDGAGETNRLFQLAEQLCDSPNPRETDVLVATGEQVSAALLAIRLQSLGYPTVSFLGYQLKLTTDSCHGRRRSSRLSAIVSAQALEAGNIVVVAGYQGVDVQGNITTLGRGASDLTAVALARS